MADIKYYDGILKPVITEKSMNAVSYTHLDVYKRQTKSGTSMSTPLVSGAIALLLERYPHMSNKDVKMRLMERAVDMGMPHNQQGWGMLDVERLVL